VVGYRPSMIAAIPLLLVLVLIAIALWIYSDARAQSEAGHPEIFSTGSFTVETPAAWFIGCLAFSVVFIPLYLVSRQS
jgi:hypothetical protein